MKKIFAALLVACLLCVSARAEDFKVKGIHIAMISQIMTPEALHQLADDVHAAGLNAIIMEWEGSFPFQHNATLCNQYAYTPEQVTEFIDYCESLGIDVIPLQNCCTHSHYILRQERYRHLSEVPREFSQVCPTSGEEADELFRSVFADVFALHRSQYVHIGFDEAGHLGSCPRCREYVEKYGVSKLFIDYIIRMCNLVKEFGKTPIIWADVVLHHPEALELLPKDIILMDWNYGWANDFFGDISPAVEAGYTFWGAPSIRSGPDNIHITKFERHLNNFRDYIPFCREMGFEGVVVTSWSTSGAMEVFMDSGRGDINTIHSRRQVYPLSGFNVLVKAFGEAVNQTDSLDTHAFVRRYAAEEFGFGEKGIEAFGKYMFTDQVPVTNSPEEWSYGNICKELDNAKDMAAGLRSVKPKMNKKEYKHHLLMLDLRINYLEFEKVYRVFQSDEFNAGRKAELAAQLKPFYKERNSLRRRYKRMNSSYIKDWAETLDYSSYMHKMEDLYKTLTTK